MTEIEWLSCKFSDLIKRIDLSPLQNVRKKHTAH